MQDKVHQALPDLETHKSGFPLMESKLSCVCPDILRSIWTNKHRPLSAYLRELGYNPLPRKTSMVENAWNCFKQTIACQQNISEPKELEDLIDGLRRLPVMFSGPHLQLALQLPTLSAYLLAYLFAKEHRQKCAWVFPSSLVKMQEEYKYGPGWLHLNGKQANVFGLSQSVLKRGNICALHKPVSYKFEGMNGNDLASLSEWLGAINASPVKAFQEANSILLNRWLPSDFRIISLDDDFTRELLIKHLQSNDGLVRRLLSPTRWLHFQNLVQTFEKSRPKSWSRHGTSMLWSTRKGRLFRLYFDGHSLIEEETGRTFHVTPEALINGLRNRELYPSLFLSYVLCSILLGIKLSGGVRQIFYMPGYWALFGQLLDPSNEEEREFLANYPLVPMHSWGLGVVQPQDNDLAALISETTSKSAFQRIANREYEQTLNEASADFSFISKHPLMFESHL